MRTRTACLAILVFAALAAPAWADSIGVDFNHASPAHGFPANTVYGYQFSLTEAKQITGLAFFDKDSNGLVHSHAVGLWQTDQTLVASAVVTNASTPVASASSFGRWLAESVTPFELAAGTYVIAAYFPPSFPGAGDANVQPSSLNVGSLVVQPGVSFGGLLRYKLSAGGLVFPDQSFSSSFTLGSFGPGFLLGEITDDQQTGPGAGTGSTGGTGDQNAPVPEPGTMALLAAALAAGFWRVRRGALGSR